MSVFLPSSSPLLDECQGAEWQGLASLLQPQLPPKVRPAEQYKPAQAFSCYGAALLLYHDLADQQYALVPNTQWWISERNTPRGGRQLSELCWSRSGHIQRSGFHVLRLPQLLQILTLLRMVLWNCFKCLQSLAYHGFGFLLKMSLKIQNQKLRGLCYGSQAQVDLIVIAFLEIQRSNFGKPLSGLQ